MGGAAGQQHQQASREPAQEEGGTLPTDGKFGTAELQFTTVRAEKGGQEVKGHKRIPDRSEACSPWAH